jgi:hypothetical protein
MLHRPAPIRRRITNGGNKFGKICRVAALEPAKFARFTVPPGKIFPYLALISGKQHCPNTAYLRNTPFHNNRIEMASGSVTFHDFK